METGTVYRVYENFAFITPDDSEYGPYVYLSSYDRELRSRVNLQQEFKTRDRVQYYYVESLPNAKCRYSAWNVTKISSVNGNQKVAIRGNSTVEKSAFGSRPDSVYSSDSVDDSASSLFGKNSPPVDGRSSDEDEKVFYDAEGIVDFCDKGFGFLLVQKPFRAKAFFAGANVNLSSHNFDLRQDLPVRTAVIFDVKRRFHPRADWYAFNVRPKENLAEKVEENPWKAAGDSSEKIDNELNDLLAPLNISEGETEKMQQQLEYGIPTAASANWFSSQESVENKNFSDSKATQTDPLIERQLLDAMFGDKEIYEAICKYQQDVVFNWLKAGR